MFFSGIEGANSLKMTALVFAGLATTRTYKDNSTLIKLRLIFQFKSEECVKVFEITRLFEPEEEQFRISKSDKLTTCTIAHTSRKLEKY